MIPPLFGVKTQVLTGGVEADDTTRDTGASEETKRDRLPPIPTGHEKRVEPRSGNTLASTHRLQQPVVAVMMALLTGCATKTGAPLSDKIENVSVRKVEAKEDKNAFARVLSRTPLYYSAGADPGIDRPNNVRAASGIDWFGNRLAIVQDDAHFLVLHDPLSGLTEGIPLPAGAGGRRIFDDGLGNKAHKMDLEAFAVLRDTTTPKALAFGSGSSAARETVVIVEHDANGAPKTKAVHAPRFYAALRGTRAFSGSQLNLEGATDLGNGFVRFFQRGNGAKKEGLKPLDATADVSVRELLAFLDDPEKAPVPALNTITEYNLGKLDGVRLTFSDAIAFEGGVLFLAAAEASPDAIHDGTVSGSVLGVIDRDGNARWVRLLDENGAPLKDKPEGLCFDPRRPEHLFLVTDSDSPSAASQLLSVELKMLRPS